METEDYHFKFRITLLGEKSVGKSTFLDGNHNLSIF